MARYSPEGHVLQAESCPLALMEIQEMCSVSTKSTYQVRMLDLIVLISKDYSEFF